MTDKTEGEIRPMDDLQPMDIDVLLSEIRTRKSEAKVIIARGQMAMAQAEVREAQILELATRKAADSMAEQLEKARKAEANAKEDAEIEKQHEAREAE